MDMPDSPPVLIDDLAEDTANKECLPEGNSI